MLSKVFKQNYRSFKIKIKVTLKDKNTKNLLSSNSLLHDERISLISFDTNCRTELFESFLTSLCHWWSNLPVRAAQFSPSPRRILQQTLQDGHRIALELLFPSRISVPPRPFLHSSQRNRHHSDVHKLFVDNIIMDKRRIGLASFIFFVALFLLVETLFSGELK